MKVLLATPYGGAIGGIARWSQHMVSYYEKYGHCDCEMDILPMGRQRFTNMNSVFKRIYYGVCDYTQYILLEKSMMKNNSYDVFHLVSSASISLVKDLLMLRVAKSRKAKTIVHFRFGRIPELSKMNNWEWKLICKVVDLSDITIVLDKESLETLHKTGFKNVALLPNPVAPRVTELIKTFGNKVRNPRTLLFAGHGKSSKGVYELVEACRQIPNIKLRMIGTIANEVKDRLKALANNASWLDVAGEYSYEKTIAEMLSCDVFVLPTYTEGFPNVILESMACGCSIVTTPVGAIPEMLEEENGKRYGILVPPKNIERLREGIEKMLCDVDLKEEVRQNVQQRVNERYNIEAVWKQLIKIWETSLKINSHETFKKH